MAKCMYCNDNRVIWKSSDLGIQTAAPCPHCNKGGQAVESEFRELEKKLKGVSRNARN